jgi:hypothetical protein
MPAEPAVLGVLEVRRAGLKGVQAICCQRTVGKDKRLRQATVQIRFDSLDSATFGHQTNTKRKRGNYLPSNPLAGASCLDFGVSREGGAVQLVGPLRAEIAAHAGTVCADARA